VRVIFRIWPQQIRLQNVTKSHRNSKTLHNIIETTLPAIPHLLPLLLYQPPQRPHFHLDRAGLLRELDGKAAVSAASKVLHYLIAGADARALLQHTLA